MELFKLLGSIYVDNKAANESIAKTGEKAESTSDKLKKGLGTAGKWAAGLTAGAAAVGAGLMKVAGDAAATADTIDKGSIRMGVDAEYYQKLSYAAGQCGVDMGVMEKAAKKLEGTDMNFDDAIASIMELGTEEERSAKAAELFGDSVAYQMAPMLAAGGDGMNELMDRAEELGLVMSGDAVAAGVKMGDTMADVKASLGAVGTQIGVAVMPVIQKLLEWILANLPKMQSAIGVVVGYIKQAIPYVIKIIDSLQPVINAVFKLVQNLWNTILKPTLGLILSFIDGTFKQKFIGAFQQVKDKIASIFSNIVDAVKKPINAVIKVINGFTGGLNKLGFDLPKVMGGGHVGFNIPQIPMLAKGGSVAEGGSAIVGEAGAELINLPKGASVTPLNDNNNMIGELISALDALPGRIASELAKDGIDLKWDGRNLGRLYLEAKANA